ncbi:SDR family oxidoreductase [Streptomyces sp. MST-110588]|uniref:SDR family oxidoreductase n=1 Tax=Streptomyces sp. MST-110588 TaxID=2833628 RepID=UPI001F5CCA7D|nr:SDR family oxidoreductase [Streptomyces sp. MST-110588]UNO38557.1 SDR family oxidoreductase [Streptomyces sp. MST-110588]
MRILITGATGVVGSEVVDRLLTAPNPPLLARTARRATDDTLVSWNIGHEPAPAELTGHWDAIIHTAASTRWTMARDEATDANIRTLRAVLALAGPDTHFVHVSTAYVGGTRNPEDLRGAEFEGYRNGYEWSKAQCESIVTAEHQGPLTVVRPPLIMGRRADGAITRFSGPYTLFPALVSGLAAVVVGDPDGYAEISPVDEVAEVIAAAALGTPPPTPRTEIVTAGRASMRLSTLVDITCETINEFRAANGAEPIAVPPMVSTDSWNRFFLPLARQWLSPVQQHAVNLLAMFQSYTSMTEPFEPTHPVRDPAEVMATSVRHWARSKPRQALATPSPWTLVAAR